MVEITRTLTHNDQRALIKGLADNLARELASHYKGRLVVGLYEGWREDVVPVQPELFYVGEETTRYILGFFPKQEVKPIVGIQSVFSGTAYGRKDLQVWPVRGRLNPEAESILERVVSGFAEQNQVTNVNISIVGG